MKIDRYGVTVKTSTLVWISRFLALFGISLGVIGLRAAYDTVGFHSTAGHIITIAIVITFVILTAVTLITGHRLKHKGRS